MSEGAKEAVRVERMWWSPHPKSALEERVRSHVRVPADRTPARAQDRKTMKVEILKEALDVAQVKKPTLLSQSRLSEDAP